MKTVINSAILQWARERNGLTIDDLAERLHEDPALVAEWEAGTRAPTYSALESLAYKHLNVPLAVFYFPEPPEVDDPVRKYRRLPDYELRRFSSDTLRAIRTAQAYQDSLYNLLGPSGTNRQICRELDRTGDVSVLAQAARKYLGISLQQQKRFQGIEGAFKAWRRAVEDSGVFTFKDALQDLFVSGFCLLDPVYPVIMVNNSNAFARQVFTLIHELGHIIFGVDGVTDVDDTYLGYMPKQERELEVACNRFAAEVLLPSEALDSELPRVRSHGVAGVEHIATRYSVSREVVLRRCLDQGLVSPDEYRDTVEEWTRDYLRHRRRRQGGNYYLTKLSYLGQGFTRVAFEQYGRGRLSKTELAAHLNMNSRHVDKLQTYLWW